MGIGLVATLVEHYGFSLEDTKNIYESSTSILNLIDNLCAKSEKLTRGKIIEKWSSDPALIEQINVVRKLLGQVNLTYDL